MRTQNWSYNWTYLSSDSVTVQLTATTVVYNATLKSNVSDRVNYHWSYIGNTVASWRLFTFNWSIFWDTQAERQTAYIELSNLIKPEGTPTLDNRWFYELLWTDEGGRDVRCMAKVYTPLQVDTRSDDVIDFKFELYSEESSYSWQALLYSNGLQGYFWWTTLGTRLGTILNDLIWEIEITNSWNFKSPCLINVVGSITNPKVLNTVNWRFFWVTKTTTNLIIDNRERPFIVTDEWINVMSYRTSWSNFVYLDPWANTLVLLWDDYDSSWTVTIDILYRYQYF